MHSGKFVYPKAIFPGVFLFLIIRKTSLQFSVILGKSRFIPIIISTLFVILITTISSIAYSSINGIFGPNLYEVFRMGLPGILIALNIYMIGFYPLQLMSDKFKIIGLSIIGTVFILYIVLNLITSSIYANNIKLAVYFEIAISLFFFTIIPSVLFIIGYQKANI